MIGRRLVVVAATVLLGRSATAQPAASAFVGAWHGDVSGIGPTRLIITGMRANGQVEGRMEFDLNSYVSTFGDKFDTVQNINHGVVSGSVLTIEAALGGVYRLNLEGSRLTGTYSRGTTYLVPVTLNRN
jgi:hypothetical protein